MSVRRLSHGLDLHSTNPCFISYSQSQAFFSSRTLMLSISEIMLVTSHSLVESLKFWFRTGAILWCWQSWPPKKPSKSTGSESQKRKILSSTVRRIPGARQRTPKRTRRSTEEAPHRKDFRNFFFLVLVLVEVILTPVPGSSWFSMGVSMVSGRRYSSFFLREIEDSILRISYVAISVMITVRSHVTHRKTRQQAGTLFMQLRMRPH